MFWQETHELARKGWIGYSVHKHIPISDTKAEWLLE